MNYLSIAMEQIFTHSAAFNSMYLLSQDSSRSDIQAHLSWVLCPGFAKLQSRCWLGLGSSSKLTGSWQNSFPWSCRTCGSFVYSRPVEERVSDLFTLFKKSHLMRWAPPRVISFWLVQSHLIKNQKSLHLCHVM